MGFKKGQDSKRNMNGRPKGSPNKTTAEIKDIITRVVGNQLDMLEDDLKKIRRESPARAAEIYMKMVDYVLPKQSKTELIGEVTHKVSKVVIEIKKNNDSKHSDNADVREPSGK